MKALYVFCFSLLVSFSFGQQGKYWIRFKDKAHNSYSLSSPAQFLSQKSLDRRTAQGISLNETDLPISETYIDSISPYITNLVHRIKWFNIAVVDMNTAIGTDTTITVQAWRDTIVTPDTFSVSVYDTFAIFYGMHLSGTSFTYDTIRTSVMHIVHDSFNIHPGPVYYRDTIIYTQTLSINRNNFDSLRLLSCIDTMAAIQRNPTRAAFSRNKMEDAYPVDQHIVYPSRYGSAYHQINMLNADLLHQMGYTGQDITLSVMDNGFYKANTIKAYDSVRSRILGTWDFVHHEADVYNDGSHGEQTFSCIGANMPNRFVGTAPGANFYLFVTEDDGGEWVMEEYNWAAAAIVADSVGAQVFSTSLGYTTFDAHEGDHTYPQMDGHTTVITNAGNMAFSKGILVVNSAGNEGANSWYYVAAPADGDDVMAIGAVDSARFRTNFSSHGPAFGGKIKPDVCTQGAMSAVVLVDGTTGYSNGTSFSCPILAGCAASLWSAFPEKSAIQIREAIIRSADRYTSPDNEYGYGIPNFYNAYLLLKNNIGGDTLPLSDEVSVYPNPFTNELTVVMFNTEPKEHKVELFDFQGNKVYSQQFYIRNKTYQVINPDIISALPRGPYFIRIDGQKDQTRQLQKL